MSLENVIVPGKRLLIKQPPQPNKTAGGILLPDGVSANYNPWQGEIMVVGTDARPEFKTGQIVLVLPQQVVPQEIEGELYLIIEDTAVTTIVPRFQTCDKLRSAIKDAHQPNRS